MGQLSSVGEGVGCVDCYQFDTQVTMGQLSSVGKSDK